MSGPSRAPWCVQIFAAVSESVAARVTATLRQTFGERASVVRATQGSRDLVVVETVDESILVAAVERVAHEAEAGIELVHRSTTRPIAPPPEAPAPAA